MYSEVIKGVLVSLLVVSTVVFEYGVVDKPLLVLVALKVVVRSSICEVVVAENVLSLVASTYVEVGGGCDMVITSIAEVVVMGTLDKSVVNTGFVVEIAVTSVIVAMAVVSAIDVVVASVAAGLVALLVSMVLVVPRVLVDSTPVVSDKTLVLVVSVVLIDTTVLRVLLVNSVVLLLVASMVLLPVASIILVVSVVLDTSSGVDTSKLEEVVGGSLSVTLVVDDVESGVVLEEGGSVMGITTAMEVVDSSVVSDKVVVVCESDVDVVTSGVDGTIELVSSAVEVDVCCNEVSDASSNTEIIVVVTGSVVVVGVTGSSVVEELSRLDITVGVVACDVELDCTVVLELSPFVPPITSDDWLVDPEVVASVVDRTVVLTTTEV